MGSSAKTVPLNQALSRGSLPRHSTPSRRGLFDHDHVPWSSTVAAAGFQFQDPSHIYGVCAKRKVERLQNRQRTPKNPSRRVFNLATDSSVCSQTRLAYDHNVCHPQRQYFDEGWRCSGTFARRLCYVVRLHTRPGVMRRDSCNAVKLPQFLFSSFRGRGGFASHHRHTSSTARLRGVILFCKKHVMKASCDQQGCPVSRASRRFTPPFIQYRSSSTPRQNALQQYVVEVLPV